MIPSQDAPCMLGWKEKVTLPAWGLTLNALIDPVSPISTLAVERVDTMGHMRDSQGRRRLVLRLVVPRAQGRRGLKVVYAFYSRRTRLGEGLGRCYIVKVPLALGDLSWDAELALIPARRRQYFLRLGRSDLEGRFQVDPGLSYCHPPQRTEFSPEPMLPMPESGDPAE